MMQKHYHLPTDSVGLITGTVPITDYFASSRPSGMVPAWQRKPNQNPTVSPPEKGGVGFSDFQI
jgi:hypothetical protein